jgi:predicted metal-dependent HD superfamily phosphohydrolase
MPNLSQWQQLWRTFGIASDKIPTSLQEEISSKYTEPHRHYHTLQHLEECLEKFAELRRQAEHPAEIELALWFHDAIYDPQRVDNERLSAEWAKASVLGVGLDDAKAQRVYGLVMATQHHNKPEGKDQNILVDCDLAILGAPPTRFKEYEQQIRAEYAFVPDAVFKTKRKEVLARFLARPTIFNTELFIACYETQARTNIDNALAQLS